MKAIGIISTAALSLLLGVAAPTYAQQDQQDQKQEQKDKPAEKKTPEDKSAKTAAKTATQQDKNAKQEEKNAQQQDKNNQQEQRNAKQQDTNNKQEEKNAQQQDRNTKQEEKSAQQQDKNNQQEQKNAQQAQRNSGRRIPAERYQANFGREHSFRVSEGDYSRDRRFQYGGYSFGFVDAWPSNWLYSQDVFVVEIDGVYYLCNAMYPGVNITLRFED